METELNQEKREVELKNEIDILTQACNLLKEKIKEQRKYNEISLQDKLSMQNMVNDHERRIKELEGKIV